MCARLVVRPQATAMQLGGTEKGKHARRARGRSHGALADRELACNGAARAPTVRAEVRMPTRGLRGIDGASQWSKALLCAEERAPLRGPRGVVDYAARRRRTGVTQVCALKFMFATAPHRSCWYFRRTACSEDSCACSRAVLKPRAQTSISGSASLWRAW